MITSINEHLNTGAVDIALISSTHFLENRYRYILLSDLGIAATHSFPSVRLFFGKIFSPIPPPLYIYQKHRPYQLTYYECSAPNIGRYRLNFVFTQTQKRCFLNNIPF